MDCPRGTGVWCPCLGKQRIRSDGHAALLHCIPSQIQQESLTKENCDSFVINQFKISVFFCKRNFCSNSISCSLKNAGILTSSSGSSTQATVLIPQSATLTLIATYHLIFQEHFFRKLFHFEESLLSIPSIHNLCGTPSYSDKTGVTLCYYLGKTTSPDYRRNLSKLASVHKHQQNLKSQRPKNFVFTNIS